MQRFYNLELKTQNNLLLINNYKLDKSVTLILSLKKYMSLTNQI